MIDVSILLQYSYLMFYLEPLEMIKISKNIFLIYYTSKNKRENNI